MCSKYCYFFEHHYNINELRFVVEANQLSKILINICKRQNWNFIQNEQERITIIKCINVVGIILLLSLISKTQHTSLI